MTGPILPRPISEQAGSALRASDEHTLRGILPVIPGDQIRMSDLDTASPLLKEDEMNGLVMKYFVLKPKGTDVYADASRRAMRVYAATVSMENPELTKELREWADREWYATPEGKEAVRGLAGIDFNPELGR